MAGLHIVFFIRYLLFVVCIARQSSAYFIHDESPLDDFYIEGDVNLAAIISLFTSSQDKLCRESLNHWGVQEAHMVLYMVNRVNEDPALLPNTTLGLVLLNDCYRDSQAVSRAVQLLPVSPCVQNVCHNTTQIPVEISGRPMYDVIGVVGTSSSGSSMKVASLLGGHKVPQISNFATSNELSDDVNYKYFSRVVPPDRFQAQAMVEILHHYNWTYISTLYSDNAYGRDGVKHVTKYTREKDMCIAYSRELSKEMSEQEYDSVVEMLLQHRKAKVVITFLSHVTFRNFILALTRADVSRKFIFISSETFSPGLYKGFEKHLLGTFAIQLRHQSTPGFQTYYNKQTPWRGEGNIWSGEFTPEQVGCNLQESFQHDTHAVKDKVLCNGFQNISDIPGFYWDLTTSLIGEAVQTFAMALHRLISEKCPTAFGNGVEIKKCLSGPELQSYIRNVSFQSLVQYIEFDKNGDILSGYDITHLKLTSKGQYSNVKIGSWSRLTRGLIVDHNLVEWYLEDSLGSGLLPESLCAKPCGSGEFYIQGELKCCWECRHCRDNEIVREDLKGCEICPLLTWPHIINLTTCEPIPARYMTWLEPMSLGLSVMATLGLLMVIWVIFVFIRNNDKKVIRGSSREMMVPIICGLLLALITVFGYLMKPHTWSCYNCYFTFHLSSTFIFGPLVLKTIRMYRIFAAADKLQHRITLVDGRSQIFLFGIVLGIETALSVAGFVIHTPGALLSMPVRTERYVELHCDLSVLHITLPLSFNFLLLLLCVVFGFLTRKLPDNFNESWYIFISVSTTIFIWIAFLSTHMMAFYAYHKAALLALALILNASVVIISFFVPKIYAVYFVDEKDIKVSNFSNTEFSQDDVSIRPDNKPMTLSEGVHKGISEDHRKI